MSECASVDVMCVCGLFSLRDHDRLTSACGYGQTHVTGTLPLNNPPAAEEALRIPPFVLSTTTGRVIECDVTMMNHADHQVRKGRVLMRGFDGTVTALCTHPRQPYIGVGTEAGTFSVRRFSCRARFSLLITHL